MKYTFEDYVLDSTLLSLSKANIAQELEPRVYDLLLFFCKNPNTPISRETLIQSVWKNRIVSHAAINRAVSELRKVLEPEANSKKIISTISKVGYQFNTDVTLIKTKPKILKFKLEFNLSSKFFFVISLSFISIYIWNTALLQNKEKTLISAQLKTAIKGSSFKATTSNDATLTAFIHKKSNSITTDIWLQNSKGINSQLTQDDFYYTSVIFTNNRNLIAARFDNLTQRNCEIININIETKIAKHIIDCAQRSIVNFSFSQLNQELYFNYRDHVSHPYAIHAFNLNTEKFEQISLPAKSTNTKGDYLSTFSSSNNQLAVMEYKNNSQSVLKLIDLTSHQQKQISSEFNQPRSMSWIDENNLLILDQSGIQSININTNKKELIQNRHEMGYMHYNKQANTLIFDQGYISANIYEYSQSSNSQRPEIKATTESNLVNYKPQYSNTSNNFVYLSSDSKKKKIIIKTQDNKYIDTQLKINIKDLNNLSWSENDNKLLATVNNQIYILNIHNKKWQLLNLKLKNINYAGFNKNNSILFTSNQSGQWQLWSYAQLNDSYTQITHKGAYSFQVHHTGTIYFTKFNKPGIFKLDIGTQEESIFLDDFKITDWSKWQLRGENIYYLQENTIMKINLGTKMITSILPTDKNSQSSFSVSNQQQYFLRSKIDKQTSNIWQATFL